MPKYRFQLLVAAAVAALALTGTATAVASPAALYSTAGGWSCAHGASDTSGPTYGSASIKVQQSGTAATITVRLRNAAPNTTYAVSLTQTAVATGCVIPSPFAQLTTNERGAGSVRQTVSVNPNAYSRQILLESSGQPGFETALPWLF